METPNQAWVARIQLGGRPMVADPPPSPPPPSSVLVFFYILLVLMTSHDWLATNVGHWPLFLAPFKGRRRQVLPVCFQL